MTININKNQSKLKYSKSVFTVGLAVFTSLLWNLKVNDEEDVLISLLRFGRNG